jgi:lysophospholipase L1-like esterase
MALPTVATSPLYGHQVPPTQGDLPVQLRLRPAAVVLAALALTATPVAASAAPRESAAPLSAMKTISASALLAELRVATPDRLHRFHSDRFGDDRTLDADGDGCSTRQEVLIRDHIGPVTVSRSCAVSGRWKSLYDDRVTTDAITLQVDRLVPLAEAWHAGAWRWSQAKRTAFRNDLGYRWQLQAVTASVLRTKGDRDPSKWMPRKNRCTYAKAWIGVKARWRLTIDSAERSALRRGLAACSSTRVALPGTPQVTTLVGRTTAADSKAPLIRLPQRPRVYFYGDSWIQGSSADVDRGFPQVVGQALDWDVQIGPNQSGAGYVDTYAPERPVYPVAVGSLPAIDADLIIVEGGLNDIPGPLTGYSDAVARTVATLRGKAGGAPVIVLGPVSPFGSTSEGLHAIDYFQSVGAKEAGAPYISPIDEHWFNTTNVHGLVNFDTFHPNTAGHAYYAGRLAGDIVRLTAQG